MTLGTRSMSEGVFGFLGAPRSLWAGLSSKNKRFFGLLTILVAGILVYANSLSGEFIWDDDYLIARNACIKDASRFHELFTSDPGASAGTKYGYYRPLFILSYALDYALWGLHATGYHILNLILHIAAAFLIFFLIGSLFDDWFLAWLVSIFFIVHPVHTETICYISGRVDPLVTCWFLTALLCYVKISKGSRSKPVWVLMLVCFACALLTKENSLVLPALLLLYHFVFRIKMDRGAFFSLLAVLLGYFIFRAAVYESIGVGSKLLPGLAGRIPAFFAAVLNYLRLLIFPGGLHTEYGFPRFVWTDPQVVGGVILTIGLAALAVWQRKKRPLIFFSIAWFFIALLPVSNLYPLGFFMAERYLYLPSLGFFLLLARVIETGIQNAKFRTWVILSAAALFLFYSGSVVAQGAYWKTPLAFFTWNLRFAPESVRFNNEMGRLYDRLGEAENAIEYYQKVIGLDPHYPYAYNNIGVILLNAGKPSEAETWFRKALTQWPEYPDALNNLGNAELRLGKIPESVAAFEKAVELLPNFAGYYNNLANAYKARGDLQKAIDTYSLGIRRDPWDAVTHYNLGTIYIEQKKLNEAKGSFEEAIRLRNDFAPAYFQLALVFYLQGDKEQARKNAQKARDRGFSIPPEFSRELQNK